MRDYVTLAVCVVVSFLSGMLGSRVFQPEPQPAPRRVRSLPKPAKQQPSMPQPKAAPAPLPGSVSFDDVSSARYCVPRRQIGGQWKSTWLGSDEGTWLAFWHDLRFSQFDSAGFLASHTPSRGQIECRSTRTASPGCT